MSKLQEVVEDILSNPNRLKPLFTFWGLNCKYYLPKARPATDHFMDRSESSSNYYDLTGAADGTMKVILTSLYQVRGIKSYSMNPDPGEDYKAYPLTVPENLTANAVLVFTLKKTGRDRTLRYRIKDLEKIEGIKKVLIQWFVLEPYKWGDPE